MSESLRDRFPESFCELEDIIEAQAATIERLRAYINAADALESCLELAGEDGTACEAERTEAINTYDAITREDMGEVE